MNESSTPKSNLAPRTQRRRGSPLTTIVLAAALGAAVGAFLSRGASHSSFSFGGLRSPMGICLALWVVLSFYWSAAARNVSAAKTAESGGSRALHLVLVNGATLVAFWPFPGWLVTESRFFAFPRLLPESAFLPWFGVGVTSASLLLALWARRELGRNWSGEVTLKVDHQLVRGGPYRFIRHPIYTGAIGMYLGPALVSGRLQGLLSLVLIGVAYARKIGQEERALRGEFGSAYDDYARESWALIPWIL